MRLARAAFSVLRRARAARRLDVRRARGLPRRMRRRAATRRARAVRARTVNFGGYATTYPARIRVSRRGIRYQSGASRARAIRRRIGRRRLRAGVQIAAFAGGGYALHRMRVARDNRYGPQ